MRNLEQAQFSLGPQVNAFIGPNGVGKTTILEALYLLGAGRSFRTNKIKHIIRKGSQELLLTAQIIKDGHISRIGVRKDIHGQSELRLNGETIDTVASLAAYLPAQVIAPDAPNLLDDGPGIRRKFLDWGVFHVEPDFLSLWKKLRHVLKQRNALLRTASGQQQLKYWNEPWASLSEEAHLCRQKYFESYSTLFLSETKRSLGEDYSIEYYRGWPANRPLGDLITESTMQDIKDGYTHNGAHRAQIKIKYHNQEARDILSRGQKKLINTWLKLLQLKHLHQTSHKKSICLIDDLQSEMDSENRLKVYQMLRTLAIQVFITGIQIDPLLEQVFPQNEIYVFHVEQSRPSLQYKTSELAYDQG